MGAHRGADFRYALPLASHSASIRASRTTRPTTILATVVTDSSALWTGASAHTESLIAATIPKSTEEGSFCAFRSEVGSSWLVCVVCLVGVGGGATSQPFNARCWMRAC